MYRIRCTHKEETKEERCYSDKGAAGTSSGYLRKGPLIKVRRLLVRTASAWCRYSLVHLTDTTPRDFFGHQRPMCSNYVGEQEN